MVCWVRNLSIAQSQNNAIVYCKFDWFSVQWSVRMSATAAAAAGATVKQIVCTPVGCRPVRYFTFSAMLCVCTRFGGRVRIIFRRCVFWTGWNVICRDAHVWTLNTCVCVWRSAPRYCRKTLHLIFSTWQAFRFRAIPASPTTSRAGDGWCLRVWLFLWPWGPPTRSLTMVHWGISPQSASENVLRAFAVLTHCFSSKECLS